VILKYPRREESGRGKRLSPRAIHVPWRKLERQLPDLANEVAAHPGERGVILHHQPEHGAYLIPQGVVDIRGRNGFAEDIQFLERLPALGQKLGAVQAIKLLSSLVEALERGLRLSDEPAPVDDTGSAST
jgi:hypothetical protein